MLASLEDAKLLAGGQSLGPMLNFRYLMPEHVIDLNRVLELQKIGLQADGAINIGAMARQFELERDQTLQDRAPIFKHTLRWVGHYATRNRGTLGGSLAHLDPSAELPGLCSLLDAQLTVQSQTGIRQISIHDWALGFMQTAVEERELLTKIVIRPWAEPHGYAFLEMSRRHGDFAIAGVGCLMALEPDLRIKKAAISVIGVTSIPGRLTKAEQALKGEHFSDASCQMALDEIAQLDALSDVHYSGEYRKRIAQALVKRALKTAYDDAIQRSCRP